MSHAMVSAVFPGNLPGNFRWYWLPSLQLSPMTANPFDQGARYTAKLDPPGFLRWLLPGLASPLVFHDWLDPRSIPFPGDPDRICDPVAAIRNWRDPAIWWATPIEFQTRPDPQLFGRLLEYLARLWMELRP